MSPLYTKPYHGQIDWTTWGDSLDATVRDHETRLTDTERGGVQAGTNGLSLYSTNTQTQNGGLAPVESPAKTFTYTIPAGSPAGSRRSESWWGSLPAQPALAYRRHPYEGYILPRCGDIVRHRFTVTPTLGAAGLAAGNWHILGQWKQGNWHNPLLTLGVTDGRWRLAGGAGYPADPADATRFNWEWNVDLGVYVDGATVTWEIESLCHTDPSIGWVTVRRDGVIQSGTRMNGTNPTVTLDQWKPVNHLGNSPATAYTHTEEIFIRNGLYCGGTAQATDQQSVICSSPNIHVMTTTPTPGVADRRLRVERTVTLSADVASSSTTPAQIAGLSTGVLLDNGLYEVDVDIVFMSAATGTGLSLGLLWPAQAAGAATVVVPVASGSQTANAAASGVYATGSGVASASAPYRAGIRAILRISGGGMASAIVPSFASCAAGSAVTVLAGSMLRWRWVGM